MDIVEMPQEDYSQDSAVRNFEKQHKSEGIGLNMQDLSYTYHNGTAVFANASIEAYPHEIVALVGPSGEGKTTMLRLILSLLTPQEGSSHICAGTNHEHMIDDPPAVFDSNKSEILLSTENKLKEIYEVFPNEGKVVLGYSYLVSWNYVTWLDFPRPIDEELIPLFKKWIRKFPENKLELMEYYSFILFEKWLYMDSLDNISEANKIYYEIKAIADELSKDYADNQVTQMLSMGIVRKL